MRVVAGTARGRRLEAPPGRGVRPTTDRVREAVFNALGSLGAVEGATVVDLFAGSGAMGIEALSRGARHCTFVDSSPASLEAVRRNLETCGLTDRATVRRGTAAAMVPELSGADLAILDPPYEFDGWGELLAGLAGMPDAALAVIESDRPVEPPPGWSVVRARSYGTTVVTIAEVESAPRGPHDQTIGKDHS